MAKIPSDYRPIKGTERSPRSGARRVGAADPQEQLSVSIRVRRRTDAAPLPVSPDWAARPGERSRYSREQFAANFGSSETDLNEVAEFGRRNGLTVVESSAARRTVVLEGSVAQMNRAFSVDLGRYELPGESYRGREGPVHLPEGLVEVVEGVFGLDNRRMATRAGGSGSGSAMLTPRQVAGLYNFPLATNANGQTIGIIEFGGGYKINKQGVPTDIQAYFEKQGLSTPNLFPVTKDKALNDPGDPASDEVVLDIEVAGSVAQGANLAVYFAPFTQQGWVDILTTAVLDNVLPADWAAPSVITISWGWAELERYQTFAWTAAAIDAVSQTLQDAAMLGVTVMVSSGDNGSDCQIQDGNAHVNYPASDPGVTAVGGTSIENVEGSAFTEVTWNGHSKKDEMDVTGGGVSDFFGLPYWQSWAKVPGSVNDHHQGRGIPDIAGHAAGYMIFFNGSMKGPYIGTSEAAPLYAGLIALINAAIGDSVGYLNPILYELGGTTVFRDIADGETNADGPAPGYTSVVGWDACTGWGSVDGSALLNMVQTYLFSLIVPTLN
jgi:kumamolisin